MSIFDYFDDSYESSRYEKDDKDYQKRCEEDYEDSLLDLDERYNEDFEDDERHDSEEDSNDEEQANVGGTAKKKQKRKYRFFKLSDVDRLHDGRKWRVNWSYTAHRR